VGRDAATTRDFLIMPITSWGPEVKELESQLAAFTGARFCLSYSSGTDALLMVLMAKGIGPGDAVICPAFTFTATSEADRAES